MCKQIIEKPSVEQKAEGSLGPIVELLCNGQKGLRMIYIFTLPPGSSCRVSSPCKPRNSFCDFLPERMLSDPKCTPDQTLPPPSSKNHNGYHLHSISSMSIRIISSNTDTEQERLSGCGAQASHRGGFSCGAQGPGHGGFSRCRSGLWSVGSVVVAQGFSCPIACESSQIRNQTLSPELAGGFFTSEPPRKPPS
ncbi:hypothetical protein MJT46_002742 [Ovis ammon polii x Ovis aries]|nr:hypothetical protein MJT46_002742 [Ovis ammon polii x Ovis aries]